MQVPTLEKIVINMGVGRATQQPSLLEAAVADLTPSPARSRSSRRPGKSIAGFKLREGQSIGTKVTLRGDRMWEFLDRLLAIAIPASVTSAACRRHSWDGRGNYTFGLNDQTVFPEINYDRIDTTRGMDVTIVTTATSNDAGKALLDAFGFPFRPARTPRRPSTSPAPLAASSVAARPGEEEVGEGRRWPSKALINKAAGTPKFKVRAYTRCRRCGRARSVLRKFGLCRVCLRASPTPARSLA